MIFLPAASGDAHNPRRNSKTKSLPISGSDVVALKQIPADLPSLEQGRFMARNLVSAEAPNSCLNDSSESAAWSCQYMAPGFILQVEELPGQPPTANYLVSLQPDNILMPGAPENNSEATWGALPPLMSEPVQMRLVRDLFEQGRGPAWWGRWVYNKTTIIQADRMQAAKRGKRNRAPEKDVGGGGGGGKRGGAGDHSRNSSDAYPAPPDVFFSASVPPEEGQKPWICTWPDTVLELVIFPWQNSTNPSPLPPPPPPPPPGPMSRTSSSSATNSVSSSVGTPVGGDVNPSAAASLQPPSSTDFEGFPELDHDVGSIPFFPKAFKLKERRVPELGSTVATCFQILILEDGRGSEPVLDPDGDVVEVTLSEVLQEHSAYDIKQPKKRVKKLTEGASSGNELTECGCMWWLF